MKINGQCHCGAVQFTAELKGGLASARRCDCSLCTMRGAVAQAAWLEEACHRLKNKKGAAGDLLDEFEAARDRLGDNSRAAKALDKAISLLRTLARRC